jgi:hypothetical protein
MRSFNVLEVVCFTKNVVQTPQRVIVFFVLVQTDSSRSRFEIKLAELFPLKKCRMKVVAKHFFE